MAAQRASSISLPRLRCSPPRLDSHRYRTRPVRRAGAILDAQGKTPPQGQRTVEEDAQRTFGDTGLQMSMAERLSALGLSSPTDIQAAAIPMILSGKDVGIQAHTGSGKTFAFLLPILHAALPPEAGGVGPPLACEEEPGVFAVVVTPSRDLAMQIVREARRVSGEYGRLFVAQCIGGTNSRFQVEAFKRKDGKPRVVVGTPGRLGELSRNGILQTHRTSVLVLDEADKLLKATFYKDIRRLAEHVGCKNVPSAKGGRKRKEKGGRGIQRKEERATRRESGEFTVVETGVDVSEYLGVEMSGLEDMDEVPLGGRAPSPSAYGMQLNGRMRQTVLVSATMTDSVLQQLDYVVKDVTLVRPDGSSSGTSRRSVERELAASLAPNVEHCFLEESETHQADAVRRAIHALDARHVLVFMNSPRVLKDTCAKFRAKGLEASWLNGDVGKQQRANTLASFRDGRTRVLVVNDVVTHGIDFPLCDCVVNLEMPSDAMNYAHRAGRTGRIGNGGVVLSVVSPQMRFVVSKFGKKLSVSIRQAALKGGELLLAEDGRSLLAPHYNR